MRADNEISSGKVCEILHLLLLFMMLFPAFLHCLQLQLMDLEQRVPLIAALHQQV